MISKYNKAFTLIELLVVIAIIGVLASVIILNVNQSRSLARDSVRVSDIKQIRYALELYLSDNGQYPKCLFTSGSCTTALNGSVHMSTIPKDPSTGQAYTYFALGSTQCTGYHIGAVLENKKNAVLLTDSDSTHKPNTQKCGYNTADASLNDFHGLSYDIAGGKCIKVVSPDVAYAQPTTEANGENCYDIATY